MAELIPPKNELNMQRLKARLLYPFSVIGYPSHAVTMAEAVPGISSRTAGIEPPQAEAV